MVLEILDEGENHMNLPRSKLIYEFLLYHVKLLFRPLKMLIVVWC